MKINEKENLKNQLIMDCNSIFSHINLYYAECGESGDIVFRDDSGIKCTFSAIDSHFKKLGAIRVTRALLRLMSDGWVQRIGNQYIATPIGRDEHRIDCINSKINNGSAAIQFRNEALTNCDNRGKQSNLDRAALPSNQKISRSRNSEESRQVKRCSDSEHINKIANDNNVIAVDVIEMLISGEIRECRKCGIMKRHHAANGKNGKRWQSKCIECCKVSR